MGKIKAKSRWFYCIKCGHKLGRKSYFGATEGAMIEFICPNCNFAFGVEIEKGDFYPNKARLETGGIKLDLLYCPFDGKGKTPGNNILKSINASDYECRCVNHRCKRLFEIL